MHAKEAVKTDVKLRLVQDEQKEHMQSLVGKDLKPVQIMVREQIKKTKNALIKDDKLKSKVKGGMSKRAAVVVV